MAHHRTMPVMGLEDPEMLLHHLMQADEFGVKLEVEGSTQRWEFFPSPLHQGVIRRIDRSVRQKPGIARMGCSCFTLSDFYLQLKDGSLKRPDLAIFCEEPELTREALRVIPGAIVEILSPGSQEKDLTTGPPIYLASGVLDVLVVDPEKREVTHIRKDGRLTLPSPVDIELEMGCLVTA
ncbi:Uma2 family endonuclease [bacterium]|nr:MAG: Uma2 family endonuclease [bacterium]